MERSVTVGRLFGDEPNVGRPPLRDLTILALDCQTTGASPARGHLLEVAWAVARGVEGPASAVESHVVRLPEGATIPERVTRLTGISAADLATAVSRRRVWHRLQEAARAAADTTGLPAICVAHYARFEEQFLRDLHWECSRSSPLPLRFVCTHQIGRRLYPDLPRRGLRALSGYLGLSLPRLNRASAHAVATVEVWRRLIGQLEAEHGVESVDDLVRFLAQPPPARSGAWSFPLPRPRRLALSRRPGVYRFLDGDGGVLYVGKATSLHKRVNSYFRKRKAEDKVLQMVTQVHDVDVTACETVLEAALLECDEIKRLDPFYNRALRRNERGLRFLSFDLERQSERPDLSHPIGPVPRPEALTSLLALHRWLRAGASDEEAEARLLVALRIPGRRLQRHALETAREGFAVRLQPHRRLRPARLLALGTRLCRERALARERAGKAATQDAEAEPAPLELTMERSIDAQTIERLLEDVVVHASRLCRRARWLAYLTEATVYWRKSDQKSCRRLVITKGKLVEATDVDPGEPIPLPPGSCLSRAQRRTSLDLDAYDRLRVLTTELRRLVTHERGIVVRLKPRMQLDAPALRRLLATW